MGLLARVAEQRSLAEQRNSIDWYIDNYVLPTAFSFMGQGYQTNGLNQTLLGQRAKEIPNALPPYLAALRSCPPAFAATMLRALVLSQMRFTFRNKPWHPTTPRRQFGTPELARLEEPWPNATTGDLTAKMEWHESLAGNSFVVNQPDRLRILRPDWTAIIWGSDREPEDPMHAVDGTVLGYVYVNGGFATPKGKPVTFLPGDVCHWAPLPDPEMPGIGMSWITPALRDIQGDRMATEHKLAFFANGATPNLVVRGLPSNPELFNQAVSMIEEAHKGIRNAYKAMFLSTGADVTVVGATPQQMEFVGMQGKGETRIAILSRVPASVLQISEGLQGSALNAGNWGPSRRNWSDTWIYPTMQNLCGSVSGKLVAVPNDSELWFDTVDMPILREDAKDQAEITQVQAATIGQLVKDGFTAESAKAAVVGHDMSALKHSGLVSVQLQPPGTSFQPTPSSPPEPVGANKPKNGQQPTGGALPPAQQKALPEPAPRRVRRKREFVRDGSGAIVGMVETEEELN